MKNIELFKIFLKEDKTVIPKGDNAVIYTRVSHSSQEENTSLESQKRFCMQFAEKKGLNVIECFGGTYESAKTDDRKEFNKMMSYLKKSKNVSTVIVYSYERFSRSGMQGAKIAEDLLKKSGIVTLSVTQELDPRTVSGSFQQQIFFMFSKMDNEMRRDKTITGMRELVRKGVIPYTIPRGYTNANKGSRAIDQILKVNYEGELLKKAFEMKFQYNYSDAFICEKLKLQGYRIDARRIGEVFRNPFYCGIIISKLIPNEIIEGKHPVIVSKEKFLKINNIKTELTSQNSIRQKDHDNLPLKRFVKCGNCGTAMTGFLVKKKNIYYYKCRVNGCSSTKNSEDLHEVFGEFIESFKIDSKLIPKIKEILPKIYEKKFKSEIENQAIDKRRISEIQVKLDLLEERFVFNEINKEQFQKFSSKLESDKNELIMKSNRSIINSSNLKKCLDFALKICEKPYEIWQKSNIEQKIKFQTLLFPDGIEFHKKSDTVQTSRINSIFSSIPLFTGTLSANKKGETTLLNDFSLGVTSSGVKLFSIFS